MLCEHEIETIWSEETPHELKKSCLACGVNETIFSPCNIPNLTYKTEYNTFKVAGILSDLKSWSVSLFNHKMIINKKECVFFYKGPGCYRLRDIRTGAPLFEVGIMSKILISFKAYWLERYLGKQENTK